MRAAPTIAAPRRWQSSMRPKLRSGSSTLQCRCTAGRASRVESRSRRCTATSARCASTRARAKFSARSSRAICSKGDEHMKILQPPSWPRPKGYSNGISARGRTIFTAGVIGWDEQERIVAPDLPGQLRQVLRNILAILAEDGAGPEHVVRMTWYVVDLAEYRQRTAEVGAAW